MNELEAFQHWSSELMFTKQKTSHLFRMNVCEKHSFNQVLVSYPLSTLIDIHVIHVIRYSLAFPSILHTVYN